MIGTSMQHKLELKVQYVTQLLTDLLYRHNKADTSDDPVCQYCKKKKSEFVPLFLSSLACMIQRIPFS